MSLRKELSEIMDLLREYHEILIEEQKVRCPCGQRVLDVEERQEGEINYADPQF